MTQVSDASANVNDTDATDTAGATSPATPDQDATARKRARPGERRMQILETLALMLEQPVSEKITTAALADKLQVSEAALYRQFASKAQMFEGLIGYIEESVFALVSRICEREGDGVNQVRNIVSALLAFAAKNPGMVRVMTGEALVHENVRLQNRMNQFFDRVEATLRQSLKLHLAQEADAGARSASPSADGYALRDPATCASVLISFAQGRLHRFAKSGFKRAPDESLGLALRMMLGR